MLGRTRQVGPEEQHIPGPRRGAIDLHKMPHRRVAQGLLARHLGPVRRIGRHGLRLRAVNRAPDAADQAETVATGAAPAGLVAIGRADPGARLADDPCPQVRRPPHPPSPREPPSRTASLAGAACSTSLPTM